MQAGARRLPTARDVATDDSIDIGEITYTEN